VQLAHINHRDITHTHLQFHTSIVALIGNARQQVSAHRRLLRLMKSGDVDAAVAELERHLTTARASVHDQVVGPPAG
jgi:DNA-binding GntR family transcriptional regulator